MIKISVPGTSANLGPGFDALGIALNIYNHFTFEETPGGLEIIGCQKRYKNKENLIYTSMLRTFEKIGYEKRGIRITIDSEIPTSRGLGSSASCILAGVMGANELAGSPMDEDAIFKLATEIEGHPDNIAPAFFGGLVTSVMEDEAIYYNRIEVADGLKFIALIPDFDLSTEDSREVLPEKIAYSDAVYNIGRVSLMLSALVNGNFELLKVGLQDRLHEQYRGSLVPNYEAIVGECKKMDTLGTYLSGAGPTIMVLVEEEQDDFALEIGDFLAQLEASWIVRELVVDLEGARILPAKKKDRR